MTDQDFALGVPCPGCKRPAGAGCVDVDTCAPIDGVHQGRFNRAHIVATAIAENRAVELAAEVEQLRERFADFEAIALAAMHYVNCTDAEAGTGEPYEALVHAIRVHERKANA